MMDRRKKALIETKSPSQYMTNTHESSCGLISCGSLTHSGFSNAEGPTTAGVEPAAPPAAARRRDHTIAPTIRHAATMIATARMSELPPDITPPLELALAADVG